MPAGPSTTSSRTSTELALEHARAPEPSNGPLIVGAIVLILAAILATLLALEFIPGFSLNVF